MVLNTEGQRDGRKAGDRTKYYLSPVFNIVFVLVVCGSLFFLFFRPSDLPLMLICLMLICLCLEIPETYYRITKWNIYVF